MSEQALGPRPVKSVGSTETYSRWDGWVSVYNRGRYYSVSNPKADAVRDAALKSIEDQRAKKTAIHEANLPAIEHNKALAEEVAAFMGPRFPRVRDVHGKEPGSRKREPYWYKETAGWVNDLADWCKTNDGYDYAIKQLDDAIACIERLYKEQKAAEEKQAGEEKRKADAVAEIRKLGALAAKYGLSPDATTDDIRDAILATNKYLRLAYWLERNRGDWTSGCDYAQTGIDGFEVENDIDKAIEANIRSYFEDFDDGRVFRDCEWNYGRLYTEFCTQEQRDDLAALPGEDW